LALPGGLAHLGTFTRGLAGKAPAAAPRGGLGISPGLGGWVIPPKVGGAQFPPTMIDPAAIAQPGVQPVVSDLPTTALMKALGVPDLRAASVAKQLGTTAHESHALRFVATRDGQIIGGYTIIIQG
jgi:hypothetical protein